MFSHTGDKVWTIQGFQYFCKSTTDTPRGSNLE